MGEEHEEVLLLNGRFTPDFPPPRQVAEETCVDGFDVIDRLGAEAAFLCGFPLLQEVPEQHKAAWAKAHAEVLRRWKNAETERETDRALIWLGFLSQGLLRKTTRGGGVGRAQVAYRFNCVSQDDWGAVVESWERDVAKNQEREGRVRKERSDEEVLEKLRRDANGLIRAGQVSQAMRRITSHGVADIRDPAVMTELKDKFPPRRHQCCVTNLWVENLCTRKCYVVIVLLADQLSKYIGSYAKHYPRLI